MHRKRSIRAHFVNSRVSAINEEPPRLASVGDVEAAHKHFHDLRTEANRALKPLGRMETPDVPADLPSVQQVQNKLDAVPQVITVS